MQSAHPHPDHQHHATSSSGSPRGERQLATGLAGDGAHLRKRRAATARGVSLRLGRSSLIALLAVFLLAGVAYASIPDSGGVIHACYVNSGNLPHVVRVIDPSAGQKCTSQETALTWNQTGPQGPQGPKGDTGPQGPQGPAGPSGGNGFVSDLSGARLQGADLRYRDLSGIHLTGGDLSGANLTGASLHGANLFAVNLSHVDLTGANLTGAVVAHSELHGANLTGANLTGADFTGTGMSDVTWANTTCPDGTNSASNGTSPESCFGHGGGL